MVLDYDGRILAQADPGPGEKVVVAPIDITALRHERKTRQGHQMLAHLRSEAYPMYDRTFFPPGSARSGHELTFEGRRTVIDDAKRRVHQDNGNE